MTTLGIGLALACAAAANVGMLCKHRGACEAPEINLRTPLRSAAALFQSRWWTIGFAVAAVEAPPTPAATSAAATTAMPVTTPSAAHRVLPLIRSLLVVSRSLTPALPPAPPAHRRVP